MSIYDQSVPRSRATQRISPAEATSRTFAPRSNAQTTKEVRGTPYYQSTVKVDANGAAANAELNVELHSSVSIYAKPDAVNTFASCGVKVEALTQLGDYVVVYNNVALNALEEVRVFTGQRKIRVTLTLQAGEQGSLYVGGE